MCRQRSHRSIRRMHTKQLYPLVDVRTSEVAGTVAALATEALYDNRFEKYAIFTVAFQLFIKCIITRGD